MSWRMPAARQAVLLLQTTFPFNPTMKIVEIGNRREFFIDNYLLDLPIFTRCAWNRDSVRRLFINRGRIL